SVTRKDGRMATKSNSDGHMETMEESTHTIRELAEAWHQEGASMDVGKHKKGLLASSP
ncbi:Hypothetical protein DEACI_3300, partial [Acididesulfobacillus acetoxydans]